MKLRQQGDWVYARVGNTEMRGKKGPQGIHFEQVSLGYDRQELDEAVKGIEEFFGVLLPHPHSKEYTPSPFAKKSALSDEESPSVKCPHCGRYMIKGGSRAIPGKHWICPKCQTVVTAQMLNKETEVHK